MLREGRELAVGSWQWAVGGGQLAVGGGMFGEGLLHSIFWGKAHWRM